MAFDISKFSGSLSIGRPRTIEAVTDEIIEIKQRVSEDFMELGQRLCEAKELLPHGEWLPWLEEKVQFSERTAQKFMALAREYAANPQLAADLGSEKAFALLALPEAEREQFVAEPQTVNGKTKPAADLSRREFAQAVQQKKASYAQESDIDHDEEDELFWRLLYSHRFIFWESLRCCGDRKSGIYLLKARYSTAGQGGPDGGFLGDAKGLKLYGPDRVYISRSWACVFDLLAVMALQDVGRRQT